MLEGLKRLEYRGYDSAGLAVLQDGGVTVVKSVGRVANLAKLASGRRLTGITGISHTRWATHGGVTDANAHPHVSSDGQVILVHNGVIENYLAIKKFLLTKGYSFASETDTEVLANLIAYHLAKEPVAATPASGVAEAPSRFLEAVRKTLLHVEGTYGIAVLAPAHPGELVAARKGSPLILGVGDQEHLIASDVSALVSRTQNVVYLKDGELVHVTSAGFALSTLDLADVSPVIDKVTWSVDDAELGDHPHYMVKEIFEQPQALENAMRGRFSADASTANFGGLNLAPADFRTIDRFVFTSCGTGWHACLVAEHLIERYARIPVEVDYASEFRYRNAPLDRDALFFVISQSGETIDTLAALREAKRKGYKCMAICNVVGSTIAREADGGIYQHAGPEIGVASTKAFTSQLLISAMFALYVARMRDMSFADGVEYVAGLKAVPELARRALEQAPRIKEIATRYAKYNDFLFLGRLDLFPIALEGALKLKEISYIHAEGYPAGEMKHGPNALIDERLPVVVVNPRAAGDHASELRYEKTHSNIVEVKAREGVVISVLTEGDEMSSKVSDHVIEIPESSDLLSPILAIIPLQLLAYHIAVRRGCDVDQPRNLAKSVTVE
jgi:glucosamine--fructose-6-phosphate aminotransferase (isomerizing)